MSNNKQIQNLKVLAALEQPLNTRAIHTTKNDVEAQTQVASVADMYQAYANAIAIYRVDSASLDEGSSTALKDIENKLRNLAAQSRWQNQFSGRHSVSLKALYQPLQVLEHTPELIEFTNKFLKELETNGEAIIFIKEAMQSIIQSICIMQALVRNSIVRVRQ